MSNFYNFISTILEQNQDCYEKLTSPKIRKRLPKIDLSLPEQLQLSSISE